MPYRPYHAKSKRKKGPSLPRAELKAACSGPARLQRCRGDVSGFDAVLGGFDVWCSSA